MDTKSVKYTDLKGNLAVSYESTVCQYGVIIPVGKATEVLIPWHNVKEIMAPRGICSKKD